MAIVRPTRAASTWNTDNALAIELLYEQLISPHKFAMPTFRLLMQNMKHDRLGPDLKFGWNVITKHVSPSIASQSQVFEAQSIDNITRMQWSPAMMYSSVGSNDIQMSLYDNDDRAHINFINMLIDSMHEGYTQVFAYELFSEWNESLATEAVDVSAALSASPRPPEELELKNVREHTDRIYSIPMLIREPTATGHTLGNIPVTSTQNYFWHPTITKHSSATVNQSTTDVNYDVVESIVNPQPADLDDFSEHYDNVQHGWSYGVYTAVGSGLYRQLVGLLLAITRRDIASPLGELGIRASLEWEEYNATIYKDPMMTWLWPYSAWTWDPECLLLMSDERWDPSRGTGIYPWESIPGSTLQATAFYHIVQLLCSDRTGLGAMHGYKQS